MQLLHARIAACLLVLFVLCVYAPPVQAKEIEAAAERITAIEVRGNRFVETATILAKLDTKVGDALDRRRLSRDVKQLYATGFFADVRVVGESGEGGLRLVLEVRENPLVGELEITGNDEIAKKDLVPKLKLKPGRIFNDANLVADELSIRRAYLKKGFYQVDIEAKTKTREDGRVDITLAIKEGKITRIKRIRFVGNSAFSDSDLLGEIASKPSDFLAWFTDRDVFQRDRLLADAGLLEQHYQDHGYLDVKVESTIVSLSNDKRWFYLTFDVHEGPRYRVGDIEIQGDLVPSREVLMQKVQLASGEFYSLKLLRQSIQDMTTAVGDEGYAFANVTPLFRRHVNERKVDITFDVEKGREVYVRRIEVSGNAKTEDAVVRRELRQIEGERYAATKVELSKTRLKRLELFEDVRLSMDKTEAPDQVDMKIDLEEKKTGSFSFGAGFSQLEKAFLTAKVEERNLLGKGINTNVTAEVGGKTQNFDIAVTDPYFLNEEFSAQVSAFKQQTRLQDITSFKQNNIGAGVSFGIPLTEQLSYGIGYRITQTNLFDIPDTASLILKSQAGKQTTGEITQVLSLDTRDRIIAPSSGHFEQLRVGIAGVGGDNRFVDTLAGARGYLSLGGDFVLNPIMEGRYIRGFGGRVVPIYRRLSLGGTSSLRGFDFFGVTVRDPLTQDVIGGNKTARASLNLFFPIPYMQTAGFRGVMFTDTGTVADFNETLRLADLRFSAGFGIEWISPVGPVTLTWGFPLRSKPGDVEKVFDFSIGTSF